VKEIPTKPYLLRALFEWCVDNGYTPHLAVKVDSRAQVPQEYVKGGEITLNISPNAVHKLQMGNELIEFSARFGGVARQISVPVTSVYALYARETGHGMTFDIDGKDAGAKPSIQAKAESESVASNTRPPAILPAPATPEPPKKPSGGGKPTLRRIK
jgi:stringent starvation protein B